MYDATIKFLVVDIKYVGQLFRISVDFTCFQFSTISLFGNVFETVARQYFFNSKVMTMKIKLFNRKPLQLVMGAALVVSTLFVSCDKDDDDIDDNNMYTVSGNSTGAQMSPNTTSTATGTLTGTYNANTNVLNYTINWNNLKTAATLVQFYGGASSGANGTLLFPLTITTAGITGSATGSVTLTDAQEVDLLAGKTYYTVSSNTYTAGEIRGQVTASPQ